MNSLANSCQTDNIGSVFWMCHHSMVTSSAGVLGCGGCRRCFGRRRLGHRAAGSGGRVFGGAATPAGDQDQGQDGENRHGSSHRFHLFLLRLPPVVNVFSQGVVFFLLLGLALVGQGPARLPDHQLGGKCQMDRVLVRLVDELDEERVAS